MSAALAIWTTGVLSSAVAESPALHLPQVEGSAHGFPSLCDADGRKQADGEFNQWVENDRLQIRIAYDFGAGHRVEEKARFQPAPALAQEEWSWREVKNGEVVREFRVDFGSGEAVARARQGTELREWGRRLQIEPGQTFAGFGFTLALECLRAGLLAGRTYELRAVGFTPHPRIANVVASWAGIDRAAMAGRAIEGDRFIVHPEIPLLARPFVHAPDTQIWLLHAPPTGFLRWQGPLAEPSDAVVRVDLLPTS